MGDLTDGEFKKRIIERLVAHAERIRQRNPRAYKIFVRRAKKTARILEAQAAMKHKTIMEAVDKICPRCQIMAGPLCVECAGAWWEIIEAAEQFVPDIPGEHIDDRRDRFVEVLNDSVPEHMRLGPGVDDTMRGYMEKVRQQR